MQGPLHNLDQWDDYVKDRYDPNKTTDQFRRHNDQAPSLAGVYCRRQ